MAGVDYAAAIPTLIGSLLSVVGAGFILVCYFFLPQKHHFRHALILNLALSDFVNALNCAISGVIIVSSDHDLRNGPFCTFNGFLGQFTVQATDLNILAIAIVTLLTLRQNIFIADNARFAKMIVCLSVWILPIITSFTALGLNAYHPVSGNWCWIQPDPPYLRYVLTHFWRLVVVITSAGIYVYVYIFVWQHFRQLKLRHGICHDDERRDSKTFDNVIDLQDASFPQPKPASSLELDQRPTSIPASYICCTNCTISKTEAMIKRTLLLNAYPIAYIVLWMPGIANRLVEAAGHKSRLLDIMQSSTQFVGLANAITYGVNERVLRQLRDALSLSRGPVREMINSDSSF